MIIKQCGPIGVRHLQAMLLALLVGLNEMVRTSINIGMIIATDTISNKTIVFDRKGFDWTPAQQGIIFSSFLWFYPFTNFIGAYFSEEIDNKNFLFILVLGSSVLTIGTPLLVYWGDQIMLTITRLLQGAFQGLVLPNIYGQMSRWFPPTERGRLIVIVESANALNFGLVLSLLMGGILAEVNRGWEYSYYIIGLLGSMWSLLWYVLGAHDPNSCTYLSEEERNYINKSFSNIIVDRKNWVSSLKEIVVSRFACALIISHASFNWGNWTLQTVFPTFLRLAHGFPILEASIITAMPQLLYKIYLYIMAYLADVLINKDIMKTSHSRKIFNTIAFWGTAACIVCLAFADGILLISMYNNCNNKFIMFLGILPKPFGYCPQLCWSLYGSFKWYCKLCSCIRPNVYRDYYTRFEVKHVQHSREQWSVVYCFTAYIYFMGNLVFLMTSAE